MTRSSPTRGWRGPLAGRTVAGLLAIGAAGLMAAPAHAHTGGQAFILLLPTNLYVLGGAAVVVLSFLLVALVPARAFASAGTLAVRLGVVPAPAWRARLSAAASLATLVAVVALLAAGVAGSRDPLANPLPLVVWTVWWIGFTYLHALLGDLWAHLNPWSGLHHLVTAAGPLRGWRQAPPLAYPPAAGCWPAVVFFLGFAWFELIHPAPADPAVLAGAVLAYLLVHMAGVFLFGPQAWLGQAEAFSVFFRMIAALAPLGTSAAGTPAQREPTGRPRVEITLPGVRLLRMPPPGASGAAFVLLALSSVTFDGFSRTFTWLAALGVNPLEYPGRTALMLPNTLGLLGTFAVLALACAAAVRSAVRLAGSGAGARPGDRPDGRDASAAGALVLSIIPIAFGYHFAHYLPVTIVQVQYAARALSDPFALGWDLFGTAGLPVITSFLSDPDRVYAIWHAQVAIIVAAHVVGVAVAHALALRASVSAAAAVRGQVPMLLLMIAYTMVGLWLLATPSAG